MMNIKKAIAFLAVLAASAYAAPSHQLRSLKTKSKKGKSNTKICYRDSSVAGAFAYSDSGFNNSDYFEGFDAALAGIDLGTVKIKGGESLLIEATVSHASVYGTLIYEAGGNNFNYNEGTLLMRVALHKGCQVQPCAGDLIDPKPSSIIPINYNLFVDIGNDVDNNNTLSLSVSAMARTTTGKFYFPNLEPDDYLLEVLFYLEAEVATAGAFSFQELSLGPHLVMVSKIRAESEVCDVTVVNDDNEAQVFFDFDDEN